MDTQLKGSAQFQEYIDNLGSGLGKTVCLKRSLPSSQVSMNANAATSTTTATETMPNGNGHYDNGNGYYDNGTLTSSSKYLDYPASKPFVNSEYTNGHTGKAVNTYPTTDRDAVISALRNLQDKVKRLEIERMAAEHNLESLTSHSDQYFDPGKKQSSQSKATSSSAPHHHFTLSSPSPATSMPWKSTINGQSKFSSQTRELEGQLTSAEKRCQLLEKQLDYMKNMVDNSERDRHMLIEKTLKARQERDAAGGDMKVHFDRLQELERDQLRLTATQNLAESKIRQIEKKVQEEKRHRKSLEDKTLELEFNLKNKSCSPSAPTSPPENLKETSPAMKHKKTPKKRKKKVPVDSHPRPVHNSKPEPMKHYRLNLAEIPFVAGKATTPSHALGANVQKVLAMMKSHNTALCSQAHANGEGGHGHSHHQRSASPSSSGSSMSSANHDLTELLGQLQEEFGQLSSEHQALLHRLHATMDSRERADLEQEIEIIVSRMESKSQQLSKIRHHQDKVEERKSGPSSSKSAKSKRPQSAGGRLVTTSNGHSHNPKGRSHVQGGNIRPRPRPSSHSKPTGNSALGNPALFMLRDMKKLQTTLRRDDLCWD